MPWTESWNGGWSTQCEMSDQSDETLWSRWIVVCLIGWSGGVIAWPEAGAYSRPCAKLRCQELRREFAREMSYSSRQVNRYLQALTGVSGKGYLRLRRLGSAVELLAHSGRTVEQVALSIGYYDTAHFVHDFARYTGALPHQLPEEPVRFLQ